MASEQHWDALRGDETGSWVLRREAESRIASLRTALAAATDTMALQRKQLRNAWAKLECRCIFNEQDEKTHEDSHCPYHGWYNLRPDEWDPIGDLRAELATATARADDLERQLTQMHKAANMALDERDKATARAEAADVLLRRLHDALVWQCSCGEMVRAMTQGECWHCHRKFVQGGEDWAEHPETVWADVEASLGK